MHANKYVVLCTLTRKEVVMGKQGVAPEAWEIGKVT